MYLQHSGGIAHVSLPHVWPSIGPPWTDAGGGGLFDKLCFKKLELNVLVW